MWRCLDIWYGLTARGRAGCVALLMAMLSLLLWWGLVQPVTRERASLEQRQAATQAQLAARWRALLALKPPAPAFVLSKTPFSPLAFSEPGLRLIQWRPSLRGGEITLDAAWERIPAVFSHLAECHMSAPAFSVTAKEGGLHFLLQVEDDEQE